MERKLDDKRPGNTSRELQKWLDDGYDKDLHFKEQADFVEETVTAWRTGDITAGQASRRMYQRYYGTDGEVSEATSTMLIQAASLWFPFEAAMGFETAWAIEQSEQPQ